MIYFIQIFLIFFFCNILSQSYRNTLSEQCRNLGLPEDDDDDDHHRRRRRLVGYLVFLQNQAQERLISTPFSYKKERKKQGLQSVETPVFIRMSTDLLPTASVFCHCQPRSSNKSFSLSLIFEEGKQKRSDFISLSSK